MGFVHAPLCLQQPIAAITVAIGARHPVTAASGQACGVEVSGIDHQPEALGVLTFADARAAWEDLRRSGTSTLYQCPVWTEQFFRHVSAPVGERLLIVLLRDSAGAPLLLLPLSVTRQAGGRVAHFIGGKHSNFNMPLFSPAAQTLTADALAKALRQVGQQAGVDVFALLQQPVAWHGVANPLLALGAAPSSNQGFTLALNTGERPAFTARLSKNRRRKLQQKRNQLEKLGPLAYQRAATTAEAYRVLDVFLAQKAERMREQGIANPFVQPGIPEFLRDAAAVDTNAGKTALEIHYLTLGSDIIAIYGLLADGDQCSALLTSFGGPPDVIRHGPGLLLLHEIVRDLCRRGFTQFDMGVGEAAYKAEICEERIALVDIFVPVSARGRLVAGALRLLHGLKRQIKASAPMMRLVHIIRRART